MKNKVTIFEVGPRDGLQNEILDVPFATKLHFVQDLIDAGVENLELGAFVRPDKVPQMADTDQLYRALNAGKVKMKRARVWALVPNLKGLERAIGVDAKNIALFTAATDGFSKNNIGMSVKESIEEFSKVVVQARRELGKKVHIRGYISTAFGCPFEGSVPVKKVLRVVEQFAKIGVDEISVGDTIGVATPNQIAEVMKPVLKLFGVKKVAGHFHDTRGTALANALRALDVGVRILDSSAGGLGGCPFAPGASGNLATEDLVYLLNGLGLETGIDLQKLCKASLRLSQTVGRPVVSKFLQSYVATGTLR